MTEKENVRHISLEPQDYFHAATTGSLTRLQTRISEEEIAGFCKGCDVLESSGVCRIGSNDQGRYAIRKWCGWARVNGIDGEMTENGFKPSSSR